MTPSKKWKIRLYCAATTLFVAAIVVAAALWVRSQFLGRLSSVPANQIDSIITALHEAADPEVLRATADELIQKFPTGPAHLVTNGELPDSIERLAAKLGLSEIVVCNDVLHGSRILSMNAPGGFGSYGVKIPPMGKTLVPSTNVPGLIERAWTNGICVFSFTP